MQSIATGVSNLIASLDDEAVKELRIAQNNHAFQVAVLNTWSDNPQGGHYLLAHTNSMYIKKDTAPRKGGDSEREYYLLEVYLDDSMAKAEFNARRERLRLALAQEGVNVDELRDHFSTFGGKERHLFPDSVAYVADLFGIARTGGNPVDMDGTTDHAGTDQSSLLEIVKRAFCLAFAEPDTTWNVLEKVEGAALTETRFRKRARHSVRWYYCYLYVDEGDVDGMTAILARFGETIISRAKPLGLNIWSFIVRKSPEPLHGQQAFPRMGAPVPLKSLDLQQLRGQSPQCEESARTAQEVRAKVRGDN